MHWAQNFEDICKTVAYNIFHIFLLQLVYNELYRLSQFIHKAWKLKYSSETFDTCSKFQDMIWEWIMNVHDVGGVRERIMKTCHPISSSNVSLECIQILVTSTYSIGHFRPAVRCGKNVARVFSKTTWSLTNNSIWTKHYLPVEWCIFNVCNVQAVF